MENSGFAYAINCVGACVVALPRGNDIYIMRGVLGAGQATIFTSLNSMSSPSSHGGRAEKRGPWGKVGSRRACKLYFQLCAISRNRRGILRSPHTILAQRWLRDLFCIFSLLYATFSYLFAIISIGLSCMSVYTTPPPALSLFLYLLSIVREIERKSSAQNVDVEMKFNLAFLLTQFCVSSESGFWPKRRMYQSYKWIYRLARVCVCAHTDTYNCSLAQSVRTSN